MNEPFPAKAYKDNVLAPCFRDAQQHFLHHYLDVDRAHAVMLGETGIISSGEQAALLRAIESLDLETLKAFTYDGSVEDFFYYLQREIAGACGDPETAGKLHTARSRNDIDVTIYRLELRALTLSLLDACEHLRSVLLRLTAQHHETVMPAYTHTQPAQPTTLAHYLLAMVEGTGRDVKRLHAAYWNLNTCPLGACAITTSGFPIDRHRVATLLGFDAPMRNSYGSIASVDYFTEMVGASAALLVNIGKYAQEFLQMAMMEFGVIRLPDGYVQASSIMPQKRNPVAMEHVRAIASKGLGQLLGVLTSVHNTPFGDINDVEDDLQPLIYSGVNDAIRAVSLLAHALEAAEFHTDVLKRRAGEHYISVTELADTLVRREAISFKVAHAIVADCVQTAEAGEGAITHESLQKAAEQHVGRTFAMTAAELEHTLSPENFVAVRSVYGGPARQETEAAREEQETRAASGVQWLQERREALSGCREELTGAIARAVG